MVDKGCETPKRNNSLISKPANIENAMLKPTENRIVSTMFLSFNFIILRRMNPGINERKTKTMISLKMGMSSQIAISIRLIRIGIARLIFLIFGVRPS